MDADLRTAAILMVVGFVPCWLAGGLDAGNTTVLPWALGFGAQALLIAGVLAWRRWRAAR